MRQLELLAPAADRDVAVQAILHGADAVYMGGPSHGARRKAANSIDDIRAVVEFAHRYRARVYVTVNTLVYENELRKVEALCRNLYLAGVDALIVQDMSLLRLDIPPIALHASTQCDTRTPEKARFLQDAGFSQIVLARELSIDETRRIADSVEVCGCSFGVLCPRCALRKLFGQMRGESGLARTFGQQGRMRADVPPPLHPAQRQGRGGRKRPLSAFAARFQRVGKNRGDGSCRSIIVQD